MAKHIKITIITGLSGSGKTTAINALEDAGFFCIDNLPVILLPRFLKLKSKADSEITKLALVMDLREREFLQQYPEIFQNLSHEGYLFEIIFLEASTETLIRRYSQTRRKHPLSEGKSVLEGIQAEREALRDLRDLADLIIDTSNYNVHQLKEIILTHALKEVPGKRMKIYILSFGYKYGIPYDADIVIDVRCLPNPNFVEELKDLNGTSREVKEYMDGQEETQHFLKKYLDLLLFLIPLYEREGKSSLTIAVGCTAGRHRSVSIAETIFEALKKANDIITVTHRDIGLERS
jgi:RNase adapter protein RapZ